MKLIGKIEKLLQEIIPALMSQDKDKIYELEIKKKINKRTIKANNYAWELMSQIAEKIEPPLSKDEVYENMLQCYGTILKDSNDEMITISSVNHLKSSTDLHIAYIGKSYLNEKLFWVSHNVAENVTL